GGMDRAACQRMKSFWTFILMICLFLGTAMPGSAVIHRRYYSRSDAHYRYVKHRRHMKTAKRVGIGAAGGAAVGALAGVGKGAGIGAIAGAGAGALYDKHQKHKGH